MQIKSWKHFQTNFCYLCGAKLNKETPYAHFSDPSQECYNLLFEGVDPVQYYFAVFLVATADKHTCFLESNFSI